MTYPVKDFKTKFNLTAGNSYGQKVSYGYHAGVDVNSHGGGNTDCGTPLLAIAFGHISSIEKINTGFGHHLHLRFQVNGKDYWAHYAHCQDIYVNVGDQVNEGQIIATMGSTGNSSHCHLHFEIKNTPTGINGIAKTQADLSKWEDPVKFIEANMNTQGGDDNMDATAERDRNWRFTDRLTSAAGVTLKGDNPEASVKEAEDKIKRVFAEAEQNGKDRDKWFKGLTQVFTLLDVKFEADNLEGSIERARIKINQLVNNTKSDPKAEAFIKAHREFFS